MMGVERTVHKARGTLLRLGPRQQSDQSCRGVSQRRNGGAQSVGPFARLFQPAHRAEWRPKLHRKRGSVPQPARGQLARAPAQPPLDQLLGRGSFQPTDDQDAQLPIPSQQRRRADPRIASEPRGGQGLV